MSNLYLIPTIFLIDHFIELPLQIILCLLGGTKGLYIGAELVIGKFIVMFESDEFIHFM